MSTQFCVKNRGTVSFVDDDRNEMRKRKKNIEERRKTKEANSKSEMAFSDGKQRSH